MIAKQRHSYMQSFFFALFDKVYLFTSRVACKALKIQLYIILIHSKKNITKTETKTKKTKNKQIKKKQQQQNPEVVDPFSAVKQITNQTSIVEIAMVQRSFPNSCFGVHVSRFMILIFSFSKMVEIDSSSPTSFLQICIR